MSGDSESSAFPSISCKWEKDQVRFTLVVNTILNLLVDCHRHSSMRGFLSKIETKMDDIRKLSHENLIPQQMNPNDYYVNLRLTVFIPTCFELRDKLIWPFLEYSKHPHIRTHDFLFIRCLVIYQPQNVLRMFRNFYLVIYPKHVASGIISIFWKNKINNYSEIWLYQQQYSLPKQNSFTPDRVI